MAVPNFFNENEGRTFPFVANFQEILELSESATIPSLAALPNSAIVDFGSVFGAAAYYEEDEHVAYLYRVSRESDRFLFEFKSTAPGLAGKILQFERPLVSQDFVTEYKDVESYSPEQSHSDSLSCPADASSWEGYLVTGNLEELSEVLPNTGDALLGDSTEAIVEPGLHQNLGKSSLTTINLANADRSRVTAPPNCQDIAIPSSVQPIYIDRECVIGPVRWEAGYNCNITQQSADNSIIISGEVGGGRGEPCEEVPLYDSEEPPAGSNLLSGGPGCNEVIRSINGVGGRVFDVFGGSGVDVTADTQNHRLTINMNMNNLALCYDDVETPDPESCSFDEEESCLDQSEFVE